MDYWRYPFCHARAIVLGNQNYYLSNLSIKHNKIIKKIISVNKLAKLRKK